MKIAEIANKYKDKSLKIFFVSFSLLIIIPMIMGIYIGTFSGFGYYIISAKYIITLKKISFCLAVLGGSIPLFTLMCSIICGLNRNFIAHTFPILVNYVIYGLLTYFFLSGLIFFCFFLLFLNEILGLRFIFIVFGILIGFLFIAVTPAIYKGIKHFIKKDYISVIGVRLNKKDHKKIFDFISQICKKLNAVIPNNILVGLTTDFYAVSEKLKVFNGIDRKTIKNNTIYISLPYLRILTVEELSALIGHEVGHFVGEDTMYAIKFAPIYRRLNFQFKSLEELEKKKEEERNFLDNLAIYPIIFLYNEFNRKEEKISKDQEFKADKFGAVASDKKILMTALAKLYIYDLVWYQAKENHREIVKEKSQMNIKNLSKDFVKLSRNSLDKSSLKNLLENLWLYQQVHPSDTHPPMQERMKNLGVDESEITNQLLVNFLPSAASLISNVETIEENLTKFLTELEKYKTQQEGVQ